MGGERDEWMSEPRSEARARAGFTADQRISLLEGDVDAIEARHDKMMTRINWLIGTVFLLAIGIFSAVVSVAMVR